MYSPGGHDSAGNLHRPFAAKNAAQDDKNACAGCELLNLDHICRGAGLDFRHTVDHSPRELVK